MELTKAEKEKVLNYLKRGEVAAAGAGYVQDRVTGEYTRIGLLAYEDGPWDWSNEDTFNLEENDEIFDEDLINHILQN